MAIKVNNTTVINDSRALQNISSVDATTAAAMTTAGVGGGADPAPSVDFSSPSATYTSSTTWTKPGSIGDDDWVTFYGVGGGGGGGVFKGTGGQRGAQGGAAFIVAVLGANCPSSITFTIGAGGTGAYLAWGYGGSAAGTDGGNTTMSASGHTYTALGGDGSEKNGTVTDKVGVVSFPDPAIIGDWGTDTSQSPTIATTSRDAYANNAAPTVSVLFVGGHGGGGGMSTPDDGQTSTYGGDGGDGNYNNGNTYGTPNGSVPGGAGGLHYRPNSNGNAQAGHGGAGSIRVYY
tara:strand:+ start:1077 stop:1946 length:870 start_codon:yes stop_codon:yes gene_type:complete